MLPKVIAAYRSLGYAIDLGNPRRVYSVIRDPKSRKTLSTSGGFTVSDAFLFAQLERVFRPKGIYVIGNAFGLSTFVLAELFPEAVVDALDAETEGLDASLGTEVTRKIAEKFFPRVEVRVGFSPRDIPRSRRLDSYELVFIDGKHTNAQMVADFEGMKPYCAESCVMVFHDVAFANMLSGWDRVLRESQPLGFRGFRMGFTQLGSCVLARGPSEVLDFLGSIAADFDGPYRISSDEEAVSHRTRLFFWDWSFSYLERMIRRKVARIFGRRPANPPPGKPPDA